MKKKGTSASSLERTVNCYAWLLLPHVYEEESIWAKEGTIRHDYLEQVSKLGQKKALAFVKDRYGEQYVKMCASIQLEGLPLDGINEQAFVYDVFKRTIKHLGRISHRAYGDIDITREIPGTIDVIRVHDEHVEILDYKGAHAPVPAAEDNKQLKFGAMCAAMLYGKNRATGQIIRIKPGEDNEHLPVAEYDELDLTAFKAKLEKVFTEIAEARESYPAHIPDVRLGGHCKYCPAQAACPGVDWALKKIGKGKMPSGYATDAYDTMKKLKPVISTTWKQLYSRAAKSPIKTEEGTMFGKVESVSNKILPAAFSILRDMMGDDFANDACERKFTKAGIERAIKKHLPDASLSKTMRQILDALEEADCLYSHKSSSMREY